MQKTRINKSENKKIMGMCKSTFGGKVAKNKFSYGKLLL